ncbi:DUF6499 domain-containing protein [Hyphomicrobium sp. B1]|uniref:transcriptional regulator domain-containing protein n=1 Tax=Hyphomicrobium sp. B1 TaxID=3075651 RepID=UPI003C2FC308
MTSDASEWRSSASYDHVEELTASGLAWEWLRRNEAYGRDFRAVMERDVDPTRLMHMIWKNWGLRFPGGSVPGASKCSRLLAPA